MNIAPGMYIHTLENVLCDRSVTPCITVNCKRSCYSRETFQSLLRRRCFLRASRPSARHGGARAARSNHPARQPQRAHTCESDVHLVGVAAGCIVEHGQGHRRNAPRGQGAGRGLDEEGSPQPLLQHEAVLPLVDLGLGPGPTVPREERLGRLVVHA